MGNDVSRREPSTGPGSEDCPAQEESPADRRRRSWARLLRKIYDVDPLRCCCGGSLRVIALIEQPHVIRLILAHLKQGRRPQRAPPLRTELSFELESHRVLL